MQGLHLAFGISHMGTTSFRELRVWQGAHKVVLAIYRMTREFPTEERYGLSSQMRRAAVSIPANIAEGFGRHGNKEFARFVRIAKGSEAEVLNHLIDARDQELITEDEFRAAEHDSRKAMKAAIGLIKHLERTTKPL